MSRLRRQALQLQAASMPPVTDGRCGCLLDTVKLAGHDTILRASDGATIATAELSAAAGDVPQWQPLQQGPLREIASESLQNLLWVAGNCLRRMEIGHGVVELERSGSAHAPQTCLFHIVPLGQCSATNCPGYGALYVTRLGGKSIPFTFPVHPAHNDLPVANCVLDAERDETFDLPQLLRKVAAERLRYAGHPQARFDLVQRDAIPVLNGSLHNWTLFATDLLGRCYGEQPSVNGFSATFARTARNLQLVICQDLFSQAPQEALRQISAFAERLGSICKCSLEDSRLELEMQIPINAGPCGRAPGDDEFVIRPVDKTPARKHNPNPMPRTLKAS